MPGHSLPGDNNVSKTEFLFYLHSLFCCYCFHDLFEDTGIYRIGIKSFKKCLSGIAGKILIAFRGYRLHSIFQCCWILRRNQNTVAAVVDDFRDAAKPGGNCGHPLFHRFNDNAGISFTGAICRQQQNIIIQQGFPNL